MSLFSSIEPVRYEGPETANEFAYRVYDKDRKEPLTQGTAFSRVAVHVDDVMAVQTNCKAFPGCTVVREAKPGGRSMIAMIKDPEGFSYEVIQ